MTYRITDFLNRNTAIVVLLLALLTVLQLVIFFGIGGRDDSYITYWSAYALSHFGEIVNYNGERIEQSSSLLQVLLLAIAHKLSGISIPTLGTALSIVCGIATALWAGRLAKRAGVSWFRWLPFVVIFVPYFTYWSSSGMETSLTALCVIAVLATSQAFLNDTFSKSSLGKVAAAILFFILVRPESGIVLLVFFSALLILQLLTSTADKKLRIKKTIGLMALALLLFAAVSLWRQYYFGQWFPQPVYAKTDITHTWDRLALGGRYLLYALNFSTTVLLALALVAVAQLLFRNRQALNSPLMHCFLFLLVYLAFIATAGGDWMEGRRLLVPVLPLLCILAVASLRQQQVARLALLLFFSLACVDAWRFSRSESIGLTPAQTAKLFYRSDSLKPSDASFLTYGFSALDIFNYSHLRDMLTIPILDQLVLSLSQLSLSQQDSKPIYIASRQMGMIPYYIASAHYKKVHFIDLRGLVSKEIVDCAFITSSKPKASSGILITSQFFLEYQAQIASECGLPTVDIIYDTGLIAHSAAKTASVLSDYNYHLYYAQGASGDNLFAQYIGIHSQYKNLIP